MGRCPVTRRPSEIMSTTVAGSRPADPVLSAALAGAWLLLQLRPLAVALIALALTVAGWRPAAAEPVLAVAIAAPLAAAPVGVDRPSGRVTVADLRRMAREQGLSRSLYRSGRRAELLQALGMEA